MKISDLETFVVGNPPPGFGGRYFIFVKLTTACGVVGYGECYVATFSPPVIVKMIEDMAERLFIGFDPFKTEQLWRMAHGAGFTHRPDMSVMGVFSGLEMACWDIVGKVLDKPCYELLGGQVHERLRSYTYLYPPQGAGDDFYDDAVRSAEQAAAYVKKGFTAVKFDPVGPYSVYDGRQPSMETLQHSELFVKSVREAVGTKADLLFGTHGQFTASGAIRLARLLEPYQPLWFEEPVPPDMPEEMARVASKTCVPIATGERLVTKFEFGRVLQTKAASILQMNLGRVGGLLEAIYGLR